MAQVFPPVPMAGLELALADVALAQQLGATLAALEGPCGVLRSELVVPADGPPWVRYVLFQAELGIALLDFAPDQPSLAIAPLRAFLAAAGFAGRYPGHLPIVAIELSPDETFGVGTLIAKAFAAAPPCTIRERSWCEAVSRLLMTTQGLTMARVMPARGTASPGPVRLAPGGQTVLVGAAPIPVLQRPRPALPKPATVPARAASTATAPGRLPARIDASVGSVKLLPRLTTRDYARPAIAVVAGLSAAALAVAALPYLFDPFSPAVQAPAALHEQTEASPAIPRGTVVAAPSADAVGEVTDATTTTPTQSAAAESTNAAPPHLVELSEVASTSDGAAPAPALSPAPIEQNAKAASVGGRQAPPSPVVGRAPIWGQPQRTAARASPARLAETAEPIRHDPPPIQAAARAPARAFVISTRMRDTR